MKQEFNDFMTGRQILSDSRRSSLDAALFKIAGEHCRKIQFIDFTAATYEDWFVNDSRELTEQGEQPIIKLHEAFQRFADSPLCHDNDRERFRRFTDLEALKAAMVKADYHTISMVYRGKYQESDAIYSTFSLQLYPSVEENEHMTAVLFVQDITSDIQQYNVSLDEGAKAANRIAGKKKILIVEDNELNRAILTTILANEYQVLQAENGTEGLELMQKYMLDISVVILDVQMPVMNGYDFLRYTQSDSFLSKIPIIIATGSNSLEEEQACLNLGAVDFVSKPYKPDIIRSRIANIIRLKESVATMSLLQTDNRTGLYTLQAFYYHVRQLLDKNSEKQYSVIIFDVDHFKEINERYGEDVGNRILQQIAGCMKDYTAGSDINGRFGAARFLFLREKHSEEETDIWIRGLFDSLSRACEFKGIGFKAGIYDNIDKSLPVSTICDRAIMALNSVGQDFEKRYVIYDEKYAAEERRLAALETDMFEAYEKTQFSVYYQPKHDTKTGKLMGAEALIRWIHPAYGFLSPGEFIPLFEKNGFISYADHYVLERTCKNLKAWMEEGIAPVPISVNSSRRDFDKENFSEIFMKTLNKYDIDPSLIHIEVTESIFSDRLDEISRALSECRDAGVKIELDDFGSGYSSLTILASLPLDVMKLDMSFMRNYKDVKKRKVLSTCIALAKSLGLETVCEGVELEEQIALLKGYGCDLIQGYYYSRPLPEDAFREYLIRNGCGVKAIEQREKSCG